MQESHELIRLPDADLAQPGLPTVEFDLISKWLISFSSSATRRSYAADVRLWLDWLHRIDVPLLEVKRAHVDAWLRTQEMQDPTPAPATLARRIAAVASLFAFAVDEEVLTVNPCTRVRRPKVSKDGVTPAISAGEARRLLAVAEADGPRSAVLVGLLLLNGMRIGEALDLDVEHLSSERGHCTVRVRGKGGTDHVVPVPAYISRNIELQGHESGALIKDGYGHRMGRGTAASILARLGRLAGIERTLAPHQLRTTACTEALRQHSIQDVSIFMRHSHIQTTARYDRRLRSLDAHLVYSLATILTPDSEAC